MSLPHLSRRAVGAFAFVSVAAAGGCAMGPMDPIRRDEAMMDAQAWDMLLVGEHRAVDAMFREMEATTDEARLQTLSMDVKHALTRHALREENVLYPELRRMGVEPQARELFAEHADMKTMLAAITTVMPSDPSWRPAAARLISDVRSHMMDEEGSIFPAFKAMLSEADNAQLSELVMNEGRLYAP